MDVEDELEGQSTQKGTVLEQMEMLQTELALYEAGLVWATILEQVVSLR